MMQLQQGFATGEMKVRVHGRNLKLLMSALGQKRTLPSVGAMSALPPKADIARCRDHVRFVPKANEVHYSKILAEDFFFISLRYR